MEKDVRDTTNIAKKAQEFSDVFDMTDDNDPAGLWHADEDENDQAGDDTPNSDDPDDPDDLLNSLLSAHSPANDDSRKMGDTADHYHNKSVLCCKLGASNLAIGIIEEGLRFYPNDVDLLSDAIRYYMDGGKLEEAEKYYALLCERVPVKRWNWRGFNFSIEYLMTDPSKNEKEIRTRIQEYKKYLPYDERPYLKESDLEDNLGNHDKSTALLKAAVEKMPFSRCCALKLMDEEIDLGQYKEAADIGRNILASPQTQSSVNLAYIQMGIVLSEDSMLRKKAEKNGAITKKEVDRIVDKYQHLLSDFKELQSYKEMIQSRISLLHYLDTAEDEPNGSVKEKA